MNLFVLIKKILFQKVIFHTSYKNDFKLAFENNKTQNTHSGVDDHGLVDGSVQIALGYLVQGQALVAALTLAAHRSRFRVEVPAYGVGPATLELWWGFFVKFFIYLVLA